MNEQRGEGKTVLIADDDRVLRQRVAHALSKIQGTLTVCQAEDGETALEILKKDAVDLVITDINMPRTSGLMVLAYLNAFLPHLPCFVMTAYGTSRLKAKMPPDLLRFYQKPFDVQDMARSAVAVLERSADPETCRGVSLIHVLQLASAEGMTCSVSVTGPDGSVTRLHLVDGQLWDAVSEQRRGEAAAVEAVSWHRPAYCLESGVPDSVERRIRATLEELLRSAAECTNRA